MRRVPVNLGLPRGATMMAKATSKHYTLTEAVSYWKGGERVHGDKKLETFDVLDPRNDG